MSYAIVQLDLDAQKVASGLYLQIVQLVIDSSDKTSLDEIRVKWLGLLPDQELSHNSIESLEHP